MRKRMTAATLVIAALILSIGTESFAGAYGGQRMGSDRISGRDTHDFKFAFVGGETARFAVVGDGYTILDVYVYDLNGNLITFDERAARTCVVQWLPRYTQTYLIRVVNRGNAFNEYGWATN